MADEQMDEALTLLLQALRNHAPGSPGQQAAWELGSSKLPEQLRHAMLPCARLVQLAERAWPTA